MNVFNVSDVPKPLRYLRFQNGLFACHQTEKKKEEDSEMRMFEAL